MSKYLISVAILSFISFQVIFGQGYSDEIVFYSNGSFFSPLITVQGNATILWTFDDGTTSSLLNPSKNYGSDGLRLNRLKVTPWSSIRMINIGYDASDGGSKYIPFVADQRVSNVQNLELAAPYLETWCSSYNMMDSLNFDDFINLKTIECFHSASIKKVSLKNTPSLKRLCLEDNDLKELDLSGSTGLEDLRAALNDFQNIIFSNSTDEFWHLCIRENHALSNSSLFVNMEKFPSMRELLIWGTNQSGAFEIHNTIGNSILLLASQNNFSKLDLTGSLQNENGIGEINFRDNKLTSVNIAGCRQITDINLSNNLLSADSVDKVLKQLDELGTTNRIVKLQGNASPTLIGMMYKSSLEAKGWIVTIQTISGPDINVIGNGVTITDGDLVPSEIDLTDFGNVNIASGNINHNFIIQNYGTDTLKLLSSPNYISIQGDNPLDFMLTKMPSNVIAPGSYTDFNLTFNPTAIGLRTATVSILNNDQDKSPFDFNIQGTGYIANVIFNDGSTFNQEVLSGSLNQAIGRFKLSAYQGGAKFNGLSIKILGNRAGISNLKLWASSDSIFNPNFAEQIGNTITNDPGNEIAVFNGFIKDISTYGSFYFLTGNIDSIASGYIQGIIEKNTDIILSGGIIAEFIDSAVLSNKGLQIPVELVNLSAIVNNNNVFLSWQTATELNNAGFEVQRLCNTDNDSVLDDWITVGYIEGKGSTTKYSSYSFVDDDVFSGTYNYRIKQIDFNGNYKIYKFHETLVILPPESFELSQNFPNPFNPVTTISYQLPIKSKIRLSIYDILGNEIITLINENKDPGKYKIEFNASTLSSGVYFYRLQALPFSNAENPFIETRKMILLK